MPVVPGAFTIRFRLRQSLLAGFARAYFNWSVGRKRILDVSSGRVQKNVTGTAISKLAFVTPTRWEQERILAVLQQHDNRTREENATLRKLTLMKQGLMQDLLTGRVRVPMKAD